ncbi:VOC family protein [Epilithonimonas mollis]|uniref:Glyoxalase/Bleomycin resistance protein/Dioxygenase superfamily protein n=1 Tax=Epilithonimonas mollis TaxID=216903 RepID=A0A1M6PQJ4_9FLAO|nr:VOC family protein [Epilithonimonas mollis]SHK10249.1 Glyoxalase/Bleomycin resistance protein/Dioxygenase superfamily protein [Epilithonimonas mollis]
MIFRYERHTQNLEKLIGFYTKVLDFKVLGDFKDHNGYDGVFLGKDKENWHLEFTQDSNIPKSQFDEDDILVFYPETLEEFQKIISNLESHKVPILQPKNPYWKENGICFEDCDRYKIIVSDIRIKK